MDKFRYYIDLGSGYVLVDVYDNKLKLKPSKKDSWAVESKELTGSIIILGDTAEDAFNKKTTNYFVPFKIEEYNGTAWNDLFECNADIRGEYLRNTKSLLINSFPEAITDLSSLIGALDTSFRTTDLGLSPNGVAQTITSTRLDIFSNPTDLAQAAYIAAFDLEGNAINVDVDTRWNYFRFYSTAGSSPNWIHKYSARSFNYRPGSMNFQREYVKIQQGDTNSWVKLPPVVYSEESWTPVLSVVSYRLDLFLDAVVSGIDSSLAFDGTDQGDTNFDSQKCYLGDGNEFNGSDVIGIKFTLKKLFNFFMNFYDMSWYLDGTDLKFRNNALLYFNSTLDWSDETIDNDSITMAYKPMPDREKWAYADASIERLIISYFDKGIKTDNVEFNNGTDMVHDFYTLLQEDKSANKLVWIVLSTVGSIVQIDTPRDLWDAYIGKHTYAEYVPWRVTPDPSDAYISDEPDNWNTRPIYSLKHDKWIDDYSAFDLFSKITINGSSNIGYLNNYEIDLNSGIGTFDIWFNSINI